MRIRREQLAAIRESHLEEDRRRRLLALRDQGYGVDEDPSGKVIVVRDPGGGTARVVSDGAWMTLTTSAGRTLRTEQYPHGRIKSITDAAGHDVRFERDDQGLLTALDRGPGGRYRFSHAPDGRLLALTYPDGSSTTSEYDGTGRLSAVTDRNGGVKRYAFTEDGQLAGVVDARGNRIELGYAGWDLPSTITYGGVLRHAFEYDVAGRLRRALVDGAEHARFHWDEEGVQEVRYRDGTFVRLTLKDGRILDATNEASRVVFGYDERGRLVSEETDGQIVRYQRNATGGLTSIVTASGESINFARDSDGRLTGITDWTRGRYRIEHGPVAPPAAIDYPNGVRVTLTTTPMGLPEAWEVTGPAPARRVLDSCRWTYDVCDRLTAMARDDVTARYRYDREGRLLEVEASRRELEAAFTLDAAGNRIRDRQGASDFNGADQLVRRADERLSYDGLGNQTSGPLGRERADYTYNGRGQLVSVVTGAGVIRYTYDAIGRRISKQVGNTLTRYTWAGLQLLGEVTGEGPTAVRRDYLVAPEFLSPLAMREGGRIYCFHLGRRGEPLSVTDGAGVIVWKAEYEAFGRAHATTSTIAQPFRLAGHYEDDETGLHYVLARYYDPSLGRFLSRDPLLVHGRSLNFYTYCDGDPLNRADPTGSIGGLLGAVLLGAAIGFAVGALIGGGIEMYRQRNQEHFDWGDIGKAALIGGVIGAIGGAVGGAVGVAAGAVMGAVAAGAVAGGISAGVEYCAEVALTDTKWSWGDFGTALLIGTTIGAVTAGVGGAIAARAARKAAREAAKEAAERAAREAAQEAADRAAREAAERAAREADALRKAEQLRRARQAQLRAELLRKQRQAKLQEGIQEAERKGKLKKLHPDEQNFLNADPRHKELAFDPDTGSFKPHEATAALQAEKDGVLKRPVQRSIDESGRSQGGDFVDGDGVQWDHITGLQDPKAGADSVLKKALPEGGQPGENTLVDCSDLTPAEQRALQNELASRPKPPGTGEIRFVPKR